MTSSALALLEAQDSATGDISPSSAFVHITLPADKFFSGRAALTKAEELRRLAEALQGRGVPAKAIALVGASVDVASGVFTKSSSVTYRVRVLLEDLELLGAVLDAVSEAKKATLSHVEWTYDDSSPEQRELLRLAGERAVEKARVLAAAVGSRLGAIHSVREERSEHQREDPHYGGGGPYMARARVSSVSEQLSGLELAPKKQVTLRVSVSYLLA